MPLLAVLAATGCPFDSSGLDSGVASVADASEGPGTDGTTTVGQTETTAATSGGPDTSTVDDTGCPVGTQGCPCDATVCEAGLVCQDGTCVPTLCGNGELDPGEDCDDQNLDGDDGCEPDCMHSTGAAAIAAGRDHTCVVTFERELRCWGAGTDGRTGQGHEEDLGDDEPASAGVVVAVGGPVRAVALGADFGCALLDNGRVRCFGANANGRLGLGVAASELPAIGDEPDEPPMDVPLGVTAQSIAIGDAHVCALLEGGSVRCWGAGGRGRLGYGAEAFTGNDVGDDETPLDVANPVAVGGQARAVAAGVEHTCALLVSGDVRCWGAASEGRLGIPGQTDDVGDDEHPETVPVLDFGGQQAKAIAAAGHHSCAVVGADDELWCWGNGGQGRLGTGATTDETVPVRIEIGGRMRGLELGAAHTCIVLDDVVLDDQMFARAARCFGQGDVGRLGSAAVADLGDDETTLPSLLPPIDLTGGAPDRVLEVAAGDLHTCARLQGGKLRCWGEGDNGRLGYGNTEDIGDDEPPAMPGDVPFE